MQNNMKVIGIDPGYERVGVAVVEKNSRGKEVLLFSDCIRTSKDSPHADRLKTIALALSTVIREWEPTVLAVETLYFETNAKTAMRVAEARGVILVAGALEGLNIREYTPLQVKSATTGDGRADKKQIIRMIPLLIALPKKKMLDDEYDAIAVALTCLASRRDQK